MKTLGKHKRGIINPTFQMGKLRLREIKCLNHSCIVSSWGSNLSHGDPRGSSHSHGDSLTGSFSWHQGDTRGQGMHLGVISQMAPSEGLIGTTVIRAFTNLV